MPQSKIRRHNGHGNLGPWKFGAMGIWPMEIGGHGNLAHARVQSGPSITSSSLPRTDGYGSMGSPGDPGSTKRSLGSCMRLKFVPPLMPTPVDHPPEGVIPTTVVLPSQPRSCIPVLGAHRDRHILGACRDRHPERHSVPAGGVGAGQSNLGRTFTWSVWRRGNVTSKSFVIWRQGPSERWIIRSSIRYTGSCGPSVGRRHSRSWPAAHWESGDP